MGFENRSPVKQVWLPLDYDFIGEYNNFGAFSKAYLEKYGIDLHDILELVKENDTFYIKSKVDLLGAYNIGLLGGGLDCKMAVPNAMIYNASQGQIEEPNTFFTLYIGTTSQLTQVGHGFSLLLPAIGTAVNSIDDLIVGLYEV